VKKEVSLRRKPYLDVSPAGFPAGLFFVPKDEKALHQKAFVPERAMPF